MDDNTRADILVDNVPPVDGPMSWVQEAIQAIRNLILPAQHELITYLRVPTPQKVSKSFIVDGNGNIGRGLTTPDPVPLYTCPLSSEAWLHRISISATGYGPASPLKTGEIVCLGSTSGETLFFLPLVGVVAPIQIVEGRLSAPHLNSGETAGLVGDQLPPNISLKVDLQIILVTGLSEFTPRHRTQSVLDRL